MTTEPPSHRRLERRAGLCLGLLISACGAMGTRAVNAELEAEIPAELRADYLSFTQNCAKCHGLERALNSHVADVRHWDLYVAKMMRTAGSAISRSESPKILRFLYWHTQRENERADGVPAPKNVLRPLTEAEANAPVAPAAQNPTKPATPAQSAAPASDLGSSTVTPPRSESIQGETAP